MHLSQAELKVILPHRLSSVRLTHEPIELKPASAIVDEHGSGQTALVPPAPAGAAAESTERELLQLLQEMQHSINDLHARHRRSLDELQACAVELAMAAATVITGIAIDENQFDVARLVRRAIERTGTAEKLTIQLHPVDLELLQQRASSEQSGLLNGLRLAASAELQRGSCRVESPDGTLLSTVANRLDDIRRILIEELNHAQIERRAAKAGARELQRFPDRRSTA